MLRSHFTRGGAVSLVALALGACSDTPTETNPSFTTPMAGASAVAGMTSVASGGMTTGVAGMATVPPPPMTAGMGNLGGMGGMAALTMGGMGGMSAMAGAAGASMGGMLSMGGANPGSATMGTQADPGTEGDGTFDQPPPYDLPPEALDHLNGAPEGTVTGPFLHTQVGTYTDWDQWKFTYYIYVPSQYQAGHPAALMVFNDGYLYAGINELTDSRFNAPTVFDNLIHDGSMPVTIAVFIFPGTDDGHQVGGGDRGRAVQYDSPNDQYGKFLIEEFLPTNILNQYDIVTDPDGWAIGGHSSGGIASIICGWFWPNNFHKMLTASPSFPNRGGVFPEEFLTEPTPKPLRIYHLSGTQDLGGFKAANDRAAEIFTQLGYHYRYRPGQDQHYPPRAAMADFPEALRWLWRGYTTPP